MAKKVFKIDENENPSALETKSTEGLNNAESAFSGNFASSGCDDEPGKIAVSEIPEKKCKKNKSKTEQGLNVKESASRSVTYTHDDTIDENSTLKSAKHNSSDITASRARTVSDKYAADLLVSNLLKKGGTDGAASCAPSNPSGKMSAPSSESAKSEDVADESQKAGIGVADSEKSKNRASEKVLADDITKAKNIAASDNSGSEENVADSISKTFAKIKESTKDKQSPTQDKPVKESRAKEVSDKYSADLIVNSVLKGETQIPVSISNFPAVDSEKPKSKKVFKATPDDDSSPAELGIIDNSAKPSRETSAEKRMAKKAAKEIPASSAEKKPPTTFVRVLKTIYRVTITTFKALLLTVPFLAVIAYTNMYVDPGRLYHIDRDDMFEYDIVRMMREGHNVENLNNYNERLVKREYINQMEEPVDVIIAGSSRGALITKEMLNADSMFNTSVAGGSLDDVIGFYGVLHQYNMLPETYIIVLDPWMLNDNHYDNRYERSIGDGYYNYMTSRMGYTVDESLKEIDSIYQPGSDEPISFWDLSDDVKWNIFSITYFQASTQRYFSESTVVRPDTWPSPTESDDGESAFLRPDGSFCYPLDYRSASAEKASNRARMSFPESIIGLEDYSELESNRKQIFIDFLRCVQEDGVEVKIVIEPISNVIVEYMKVFERYENFFKAEDMVRGIAADFGIEIAGSFDPEKLEFDMNCFYDGYHLKEQYIEEIVQPFSF